VESHHDLISLFEHDLLGKPVSTFPDHALDFLKGENTAMPVKIKLGLSLVTILVAAIATWYQHLLGHDRIQYVVAFLGLFMIFAMWLFPEVKREETSGGVKRDAAPGQG
jgi:hypothetical protein